MMVMIQDKWLSVMRFPRTKTDAPADDLYEDDLADVAAYDSEHDEGDGMVDIHVVYDDRYL